MRRRIAWLVAATTSAVVLAFVIPLCLLVRTVAADRALAAGNEEARSVATLISGVQDDTRLAQLVAQSDLRSRARTSVLRPDGSVLGSPDPDLTTDPHAVRAAKGAAFTAEEDGGAEIFIPVVTESGTSVVQTRVGADQMRAGVYRAWGSILLLGSLLLGAAVVVADRLGRRISEPVTDLAGVAQRLHEGDLEARARPQGPEETVELAETLNRLADRISELLAAERAAVGDLSHRLRTPVTALRLDAESVADGQLAHRLQDHIAQLQRTVDAVVRDARRPLRSGLGSSCDAVSVVAERTAFWSALAEDQGRPVRIELPDRPVLVALDPSDLTDMLDVLVDNVFAHTHDDVAFVVRLVERTGQVLLEVEDSGPGPGPAGRTDPGPGAPRPGSTGLGLQIVRRTAARVGGHLALDRSEGRFVARVTLPKATPGHHPHPA